MMSADEPKRPQRLINVKIIEAKIAFLCRINVKILFSSIMIAHRIKIYMSKNYYNTKTKKNYAVQ